MAEYIKAMRIPVDEPYGGGLVFVKQADCNSRYFRIGLTKGGEVITDWGDITLCAIAFVRADGQRKAFSGDYEGDGAFYFPLPTWAAELSGNAFFDVQIYFTNTKGDAAVLRSALVKVRVQGAAYEGEDIGEDITDTLTALIVAGEELKASMESALEELESVTESATALLNQGVLTADTSAYTETSVEEGTESNVSILALSEDNTPVSLSLSDLLKVCCTVIVTEELDEDADVGVVQLVLEE